MASEKLAFTFPPRQVREPVAYHLVKDCDLQVNILRANISPDEAGHMVVEVVGTPEQLKAGHAYLKKAGVAWQPLSKDVHWSKERCTHCTACISVCPTAALKLDRKTMKVSFDTEKCIACELCIPVRSYRAMEILF
jgi:L-aspartate semialdehyde sulfurtransferase ferredoxin